MKLDVPFYINKGKECGPVALRMVLACFGEQHSVEDIQKRVSPEKGGGTFTIGLAKAAAEYGFPARFFSKKIGFNPKNYEMEFYKRESHGGDKSREIVENLAKKCKKLGVEVKEETLSLKELLRFVSEDSIPIILIDWHVVEGREAEGYQGHIVPLVGYDTKDIYVHNPGPRNPSAFFPIKKELFDRARKAKGTDEDIVVVYRKRDF